MTCVWTSEETDGRLTRRQFTLPHLGRSIPGVLWTPDDVGASRPLVLVGHGGSQHKLSSAVLDVALPLAHDGYAVAAIDGPVHGDRRTDDEREGAQVIREFRALWVADPRIEDMVSDWRAVVDELVALPAIDAARIGWFGISMGTAYGLPVVAADDRIRAAVLGMWGTSHAHGDRLLAAARQVRCPVLFQRQRDDPRFTVEGQEALYEALGSADKRWQVYEGTHVNPFGVQLDEALGFLRHHLAASA